MVTLILTLTMCTLLFLMIWSATYFYPWTRLLRFFPKDIEEKARLHQPPFPAVPVIGWILMLLCALGFVVVIVYGGCDGVRASGSGFSDGLTHPSHGARGKHFLERSVLLLKIYHCPTSTI